MTLKENTKYIKIDYPSGFMLSVYDPNNGYLLFPDALDLLLEYVGGYKLVGGYLKKKDGDYFLSTLIYKSSLDSSFILVDVVFGLIPIEVKQYVPLMKILNSTIIYEDKRIDASDIMTELINCYPKKIDLLSFLFEI
ncbi:MAG: hypothetical protein N3D78_03235 [Candidatus Aenigmarchaeota archaeon]|nr:hypothetical protein [Candidatus Aenigmarchaeota archaeon]